MPLPLAGARIRAADLASIFPLGVDAWEPYTPTVTQNVAITKTVNRSAYTKTGRSVTYNFDLALTSAGTAANAITVSLPETPAAGVQSCTALFLDASAPQRYVLVGLIVGGVLQFRADNASTSAFGVGPAVTIASGDSIQGSITYEATS